MTRPIIIFCRRFLMLLLATQLVFGAQVSALSADQKRAFNIGARWFSTDEAECLTDGAGVGAANLTGSDNMQKAFNYFVSQGYTSAQSAGLVGNFISESGMNPTITNNSIGAYGIAQWLGGRKTNLHNLSGYDTLETQVAFVVTELSGSESAANGALKAVSGNTENDAAQAASAVAYKYERPESINGKPALLDERMANAKGVFNLYGNGAPAGANVSTATIASASSGCGGSSVTNGDLRSRVVALAKQELAAWDTSRGEFPQNSKYTGGVNEAWCADFASWIYNEAGYPIREGGNWRVPPVLGIQEIGQAGERFVYHPVGDGYTPAPGDMAIYGNNEHVNIVIEVSGGKITTIGGNESNNIKQSEGPRGNLSGYVSPK